RMASRFYVNHVAYERNAHPSALLDVTEGTPDSLVLLDSAGWTEARRLTWGAHHGTFRGRKVARVDLSGLPRGRYVLRAGSESSKPFLVGDDALWRATLDALLGYFRSQRADLAWDAADRSMGFVGGRTDRVDVHGGWYDASGDVSKYLSHLSYANFMNPQQTPIVVWGLLEHYERLSGHHASGAAERLRDEARHGAEFLARMQDPAGYFYMTVFDQWSKFPERRVICSYRTQKGELLPGYQAGFRQGGGATIAALARAGRVLGEASFVAAAERGFAHLEQHNLEYLDDGHENVIDDYCALLAACELYAANSNVTHLQRARHRAASLVARIREDGPVAGWLRADSGDRPFFHAAEAGLPAIALLRLAELDREGKAEWLAAATRLLRFELAISRETENPYGYARQYVQDVSGHRRTSFFIPHQNETGYWWQGENARLASLAAAAGWLARELGSAERALANELRSFAFAQLDWICGKNPFDSCMLHGFGFHNRSYMDLWPSAPGGICNGITASHGDEADVDFGRDDLEGDHGWRWYEQWLPHAAWFLIALGELHTQAESV
ncbi:MAG TPA: glycoside hydrolase family 9 protein, partial [Polyangiaceae bacterium]|nr:glycoside hydrolase family 9 protein [Polyangiaceae bacterium]